jgi:hypothetical protein
MEVRIFFVSELRELIAGMSVIALQLVECLTGHQ